MTYLKTGALRLDRRTASPLLTTLSQRPRRTRPKKAADGPAIFSATTQITRQPFRWDCNGFYRILGVPTDATRVELARAYMALDGYRDPQITYAFSVLLRPSTRAAYDALPLGTFWAHDPALAVNLRIGDLEDVIGNDWTYYLDVDIEVEDVPANWPFVHWRSLFASAIRPTLLDGLPICLGVTRTNPRIELLGYNIVIFMMVDEPPSPEYARLIAHELVAMYRQ